MSKHPIDDLFARQLREHGLKPERATWEELQRRMNAKEARHSSFVWWYASAASVATVLLVSWWMWSGNGPVETNTGTNQMAQQVIKKARPDKITIGPAPQTAVIEPAEEPVIASNKPVVRRTTATKASRQPIQAIERPQAIEAPVPTVAVEDQPTPDVQIAEVDKKESERTLVVKIATPAIEANELVATTEPQASDLNETDEEQPRKKRFRIGRVLRQLNKLKAGEPVEWREVGIQPGTLMARASEKVQEGKEKLSDSYDNLRYNTFRKNSNNK
ncbi:hypothetical protein LX87_00302 [Larkinella arboricola]|uniref:Uncharacterized protein n=1 Tax=Larkinella arboricola TaxID=643671 RepID=A0A327XD46_LARAB|nr:hypothetical protein [Larkinella arboricola]RAK02186.1 hypothetical protein LX87_00302 [Larkinella arboricola]